MLPLRVMMLWTSVFGSASASAQAPSFTQPAVRPPLPPPLRHVFLGSQLQQGAQGPTGRVVDADFDNLIIRPGDHVRVTCGGPCSSQVGDSLFTFASSAAIRHPVGGYVLGHLTDATGLLTVTHLEPGGAVLWARVEASVMEIERGQKVLPLATPLYQDIVPKWPNPASPVAGRVVAIGHNLLLGREERPLFVDVGGADGLQPGDTLMVLGRRDTVHPPLPKSAHKEAMALLVLVNVGEHVSTAIPADGLWEVALGDLVTTAP